MMTRAAESPHEEKGEFRQLLSYTIPGYASGILLAAALDHFGLQRSGIGQWLVRTLSGEGESLFEGAFAVRQRLRRASVSMAEAYGWGKLVGMAAPWLIDWGSRALGVNVYGVGGFYIPYFYALSDQIGANVSGLLFLRREQGTWPNAAARYARDPVMLASLAVILARARGPAARASGRLQPHDAALHGVRDDGGEPLLDSPCRRLACGAAGGERRRTGPLLRPFLNRRRAGGPGGLHPAQIGVESTFRLAWRTPCSRRDVGAEGRKETTCRCTNSVSSSPPACQTRIARPSSAS